MTTAERINEACGQELCTAVRRRRRDNKLVVFGKGGGHSIAQYNILISGVRHVIGSAIVRWNGQERVV